MNISKSLAKLAFCFSGLVYSTKTAPWYSNTLKASSRGLSSNVVLPDTLQDAIGLLKPVLQKEVVKSFPASYGNCNDKDPPLPCEDTGGDLYYQKNSWSSVRIRWIAGLNDIQIETLDYNWDAETLEMSLKLVLLFPSLPMSIRAEACVPHIGCAAAFDNTDACCGPDRRLEATLKMSCSDSFPHLHSGSINNVQITPPLEVQANILGKYNLKLQDITGQVEAEIKKTAQGFLNGETMDDLNNVIRDIGGDSLITCKPLPPTTTEIPRTTDELNELPNVSETLDIGYTVHQTPGVLTAILVICATIIYNSYIFRK